MSAIQFNCRSKVVSVWGVERANMMMLCKDLLAATIKVDYAKLEAVNKVVTNCFTGTAPPSHSQSAPLALQLMFNLGNVTVYADGRGDSGFTVGLNSALCIGNDAIKLMARLNGQCEMHCWVADKNRHWLANIIEQGLSTGIFRRNVGTRSTSWHKVVELLRSDNVGDVVCSYSVSDNFPNSKIAGLDEDEYNSLKAGQQWDAAMDGLRTIKGLELTPDNWESYRFGNGLSGFDAAREIWSLDQSTSVQ